MFSQQQSTHFITCVTVPHALWIFSVLTYDYNLLESKQIPMHLVSKKAHFTQSYQQNPLCQKCSSYAVNKRDSAVKY